MTQPDPSLKAESANPHTPVQERKPKTTTRNEGHEKIILWAAGDENILSMQTYTSMVLPFCER